MSVVPQYASALKMQQKWQLRHSIEDTSTARDQKKTHTFELDNCWEYNTSEHPRYPGFPIHTLKNFCSDDEHLLGSGYASYLIMYFVHFQQPKSVKQ